MIGRFSIRLNVPYKVVIMFVISNNMKCSTNFIISNNRKHPYGRILLKFSNCPHRNATRIISIFTIPEYSKPSRWSRYELFYFYF